MTSTHTTLYEFVYYKLIIHIRIRLEPERSGTENQGLCRTNRYPLVTVYVPVKDRGRSVLGSH